MASFKLKIIASNKVFFDGEANQLILPMPEYGSEGFLANHENTIVPIEAGEMKIEPVEGDAIEAFVGDGFLEFLDNNATLVCISAELPDEIDARRAQEAKERAEEEMLESKSYAEYIRSQTDLARAMERLKVKNRHQI